MLGAQQRGDGCLHWAGYIVTWAIGHLVALAEPHQIQPEWSEDYFGATARPRPKVACLRALGEDAPSGLCLPGGLVPWSLDG